MRDADAAHGAQESPHIVVHAPLKSSCHVVPLPRDRESNARIAYRAHERRPVSGAMCGDAPTEVLRESEVVARVIIGSIEMQQIDGAELQGVLPLSSLLMTTEALPMINRRRAAAGCRSGRGTAPALR
jgi:hypothetical protein